ncbi:MAG: reverse transcriptase domain-containing protein, partial [Pirellulales bacterium]
PNTHVAGESDGLIIPRKQTNKAGPTAVAESVEGRGPAKGNTAKQTMNRTQSRRIMSFGLHGVRKAARRDKRMRFTALLHHITPELLRASFLDLNRQAVPGIDDVTWRDYANGLEDRIADLHNRIHRGTYRAQPSKRTWIPKADGRQRPLGIAALEDKVVQQAAKTVLECIYEADFLGFSYGFRPGRGGHDALDALWVGLTEKKVNWLLDADIRGFFDAISHGGRKGDKSHYWRDGLIKKLKRPADNQEKFWSAGKTRIGSACCTIRCRPTANLIPTSGFCHRRVAEQLPRQSGLAVVQTGGWRKSVAIAQLASSGVLRGDAAAITADRHCSVS